MSDDWVPEERAQEYHQLLTDLRASSHRRVWITTEEQMHILAQVRERLAQAPSTSTLSDAGSFTAHLSTKPARKPTRFVATLLTAMVVLGLLFGSWALLMVHSSLKRIPASTAVSRSGPTAQTQVGSLQASMHVLVGGPYFLSELLPIDVSLTNQATQPFLLTGTDRTADLCFSSALMVELTAGSNPSFLFSTFEHACTQPAFITQVESGQTLTIHQYIPLTKSREVTLTMGPSNHYSPDPLNGHWPTVHIQVNPQVPRDRVLSLHNQNRQVLVTTSAGVQAHLLYMQSIACDNYSDSNGDQWTPLTTNVLDEPACPTAHPHWVYIVSAPGFPIVYGSQTA